MNILNGLPYWAQGAIIRAIRTFVLLFAASLAAIPIAGVSLQEYLQAVILMIPGIIVIAIEKGVREYLLDKSNAELALDTVADAE
jgi:hypothetical protein